LSVSRFAAFFVPLVLCACVTVGSSGAGRGERDWAAYGEGVYAMPENQRFAAYAGAEREHAASPSANSALRLAILTLGIDRPSPDYEFVLSLLSFAGGATGSDATRAFAEFLRPVVQRLANLQASLDAESRERRSFEAQLEALRDLEEQLNQDGGGR
jgi:hypothetical protein